MLDTGAELQLDGRGSKDGGKSGQSAVISRNLKMEKRVRVREGDEAAGVTGFSLGRAAGRQSLPVSCGARATARSSCVSQPLTTVNFKHIFTLLGSNSWQHS